MDHRSNLDFAMNKMLGQEQQHEAKKQAEKAEQKHSHSHCHAMTQEEFTVEVPTAGCVFVHSGVHVRIPNSAAMVEIDGKKYAQNASIPRYMAKQVGLYPMSDHLAALEVDMVVDTTADMLYAVIEKNFLERDAERKAKQTAKLNKYVLPAYLEGLHSRVPENKGYVLGDQISLADLAVFHVVENVLLAEKERFPLDVEAKYPKLLEVVENVKAEPSIAEYLADEKNHRRLIPTA